MKYLPLATALMGATAAYAETPELTIYTYDSFVAEWGPGPQIEANFEETCGCDLTFVAMCPNWMFALVREHPFVPESNSAA